MKSTIPLKGRHESKVFIEYNQIHYKINENTKKAESDKNQQVILFKI